MMEPDASRAAPSIEDCVKLVGCTGETLEMAVGGPGETLCNPGGMGGTGDSLDTPWGGPGDRRVSWGGR